MGTICTTTACPEELPWPWAQPCSLPWAPEVEEVLAWAELVLAWMLEETSLRNNRGETH